VRIGEPVDEAAAALSDHGERSEPVTDLRGADGRVDITANSITVSVPRGVPGAPVTATYLVQSRSLDYTRLQLVTDLAQRVVDTAPEPERVRQQLDSLEQAPFPCWPVA
jgi:uncharacterized membrane protein YjjP (DUF1212 family)